jgi:hypothetical protein
LLHARVIVTTYNQHLRLLSPEPSFVGCYKSKIAVVMESAFTDAWLTRGNVGVIVA